MTMKMLPHGSVSAKLSSFSPLTAAIQNPSFPSALAFQLAKVNRNPSCVYLIRSLPLRVSRGPTGLPRSPH